MSPWMLYKRNAGTFGIFGVEYLRNMSLQTSVAGWSVHLVNTLRQMTCLADLLTSEEYHREPQANITLVGSKALQIRPSASVKSLSKLLVNLDIRIHGPRL